MVTSLGTGASSAATTTVTIPANTTPGTYYLGAIADTGSTVTELDEGNNSWIAFFTTIQVGRPDLVITALSGPATGATSKTVAISNTVRNQGATGTVAANFQVGLYLSTDNVIDTGDTFLGFRTVASLAAGASSAATTTVTIPANTTPGTYYLGAIADRLDSIPESDDANNAGAALTPIEIALYQPDLVITVVSGPVTVTSGGTVAIANTVRNQGPAPATSFTVSLYLSTDSTITTGDTLLGSRMVASLGAGASSAATTSVTISAAPGTYYLGVIADPGMTLTELNEGNNAGSALNTIEIQ
jgi:large repetitive protein